MTINNTNSMNSVANIGNAQSDYQKMIQRIAASKSVGSTDGASMQIFDDLQSEVDTYTQGIKNANDAVGYLQIADGATKSLTESTDQLNVLSAQYNNAALSQSDKTSIVDQANKIKESMSNAIQGASFGGKNVFSGEASFYTGSSSQSFSINTPNIDKLDIGNQDSILSFQKELASMKSTIGSNVNSITASINTNMNTMIGLSSAKSQIGDTDYAQSINSMSNSSIRLNFATISLAHNNSYLASKVQGLLR